MNSPRWTLGAAVVALLAAASPPTISAQGVTTGAVAGIVTTAQGQPLEGVQVQALNRSTGFRVAVTSRSNGRYNISGLEVGSSYTISARHIGYQPQSFDNISVALSQTARVDFQLGERAAVLSGVTVTAESQDVVISRSHTGVVTTVTDSALRRLPTLNRNFTDFVQLTPQVSTSGPGLSGGGVNNRYNNIQIDGSTETDLFGLGSTGQPGGQANGKSIGLEAVREYQVLLSPYDVRAGNFAGVLINAVTKSGTNEFHGVVFDASRNQNFVRQEPFNNKFNQSSFGGAIGGPIVRDKVLFFLDGEFQQRTAPATGPYLGSPAVSLTQGTVDQVNTALQQYNVPGGSAGIVNNKNPLANVFGRLDFNLSSNTQLVLRHNYGHAVQDVFDRSNSTFQLTSNGYQFTSDKNATVAQLRTTLGNGSYNELFLDYTTIRDRRNPNVRAPQVSVLTGGYTLVAGSERFSQGNQLDQDITELTDNFTVPVASHRFTIGTQNQFYKVRNLFTQASYGAWSFSSLDSLNKGLAKQYIVGVPLNADGAVRFRSSQYAGYLQDDWAVSPNFNLTYGVRADIPTFNDRPPFNQSVMDSLGRNTSDIPTGHIQWSPRVGFNWDVTGNQVNQLRGGFGEFTGRPAFVWLSNAFQNSGSVGVGLLTCNPVTASNPKGGVPAFTTANAATPPKQCVNGLTARAGGEIDLLDPNLKFPQTARFTLGYDRRLGERWIATVEGLYTRGVNDLFYQNIALASQAGILGVDRFGRAIFGPDQFKPVTKTTDRSQVFNVTNQSNNYSYQLTGGLQRRFFDRFEGSAFYTNSHVYAVQDFTSSTSFSQYRFGRVWGGDQSDKTAARSIFEQRHRIVAQGTYSFPSRTDVTLYYIGQSGTPYGYTVNGDQNGDGVSLNDPIYVPKDAHNPSEILFKASPFASVQQQQDAFESYINGIPCLRNNRGRLLPQNACENPFTNTMNVSFRQSLPTTRAQNVSVQLDVINLLNLLNDKWGKQPTAGFGSQTLLDLVGKTAGTYPTAQPIYQFNPSYQRFNADNLFSVYQLQLQVRYSF